MHILITGVSSFVGSHLARHFLQIGHDITATYRTRNTATDRLSADFSASNLRLVSLDLADRTVYSVLPPAIDTIVHVAGVSAADGLSVDGMLACNVEGARNLIQHALGVGVRTFIYTSTLSVHGKIEGPIVDENTPIVNPDVYGASKYLAERMLAAAAEQMPSLAIRLPGVLGVGAHRAWLPILLKKIKSNRDITIFNPGAKFNNAAHIDDLGAFFAQLMQRDWKGFFAFPIGAAGMTSVREAVERIKTAAGSSSKIVIDPMVKPGFVISSERAIAFGYRPMTIDAMLDRFVKESANGARPR
jgi:nucleoside-diphosphate-sugar epimerase